jgi:hypothetical protein
MLGIRRHQILKSLESEAGARFDHQLIELRRKDLNRCWRLCFDAARCAMESQHSMARVDNVGSGIRMEDMLFLLLENLGVETVRIQHSTLCAVRISAWFVARCSYLCCKINACRSESSPSRSAWLTEKA